MSWLERSGLKKRESVKAEPSADGEAVVADGQGEGVGEREGDGARDGDDVSDSAQRPGNDARGFHPAANDSIPPQEVKNDRATPVIDKERGIPSVNNRTFRSRAVPVSLGAGLVALVAAVWLMPGPKTPAPKAKDDPKATADQRFDDNRGSAVLAPATPPLPPTPVTSVVIPTQPVPLTTPRPPIQVIPAPDPRAAPRVAQPASAAAPRPLTALERRQRSKMLIVGAPEKGTTTTAIPAPMSLASNSGFMQTAGAGGAGMSAGGGMNGSAGGVSNAGYGGGGYGSGSAGGGYGSSSSGNAGGRAGGSSSGEGPLGDSLRPTIITGTAASKLADRTFMLTQGTLMDCNLDVAISSAVPGMVKCTLTRDMYGEDRRVVLLERGTEVTGQYQGALQQGQSRLFILWTRAKTPGGVVVSLASPGTDSLGRGGVDGYIDTHFWDRFGAALFLSIIDDSLGIIAAQAQNRSGNGNNTVVLPQNTTNAAKSAAAIAVESTVNIPPTLVKNQGEHVGIFVARDLDFRSVYAVKAVDPGQ